MTLVSISGGAGFLGLHLARRVLADGGSVRTLDVAALEDRELELGVEEIRGDVRSERHVRALVSGADVLVHAAAALPIQSSRAAIRSVNVEGTATVLAAALEAGVRRVVLISSTAVYGVPERHPIHEEDPLVGVGWYGGSKIEAELLAQEFGKRGLDAVVIRPKTFIGPERLGVFEILFDWIRDGRRSDSRRRKQPLPTARGRGSRRRRESGSAARRGSSSKRISKTPSRSGPMKVFGRIDDRVEAALPEFLREQLGLDLRSAVPADADERVLLVDRVPFGHPVDRGGRDQDDPADTRFERGGQHGRRALHVDGADRGT